MRLIDADALKARFTEELFERSGLSAQGIIDEAPTIAPSGDLISRADAIKAVMAEGRKVYTSEYANAERIIYEADAVETLSMLPSADAVHGEWIMHIDDLFPEESTQECSNCHEHETIKIRSDNFCPNCGAKMDGERGDK